MSEHLLTFLMVYSESDEEDSDVSIRHEAVEIKIQGKRHAHGISCYLEHASQ